MAQQFASAGADKPGGALAGVGTGFVVSVTGHVVTNAHVIQQCRQVRARHVTGEVAELASVATDQKSDLALLKGNFVSKLSSAGLRDQEPPLGESIVVFGFPLSGTLAASGNLTTGTLSGLAGVQNDPLRYQISAPVQPGNSGGAVLDEGGLVIGVVQSKLNAARVQMVAGDLPQNVNFAVKGRVLRDFLSANKVAIDARPAQSGRKVSSIAEEATRFSVMIGCFR